tara:strand:+ start:407 stop:607 length:201 start_codon:yes stop_codon:yes gene_type:complete
MSRVFRIVEARCPHTNLIEKRKVYTTDKQYKIRGLKSIKRLKKLYNITVIKFTACKEEIVHIKNEK